MPHEPITLNLLKSKKDFHKDQLIVYSELFSNNHLPLNAKTAKIIGENFNYIFILKLAQHLLDIKYLDFLEKEKEIEEELGKSVSLFLFYNQDRKTEIKILTKLAKIFIQLYAQQQKETLTEEK